MEITLWRTSLIILLGLTLVPDFGPWPSAMYHVVKTMRSSAIEVASSPESGSIVEVLDEGRLSTSAMVLVRDTCSFL